MKRFNVTGLCVKEKHYMVDMREKLEKIMKLIDEGYYFTINRARQYGKTTTLSLIAGTLPSDYTCISLSFEGVGETMFESPASFCQRFLLHVSKALEHKDKDFAGQWLDGSITDFDLLGYHLDKLCEGRKIVLLIDEIDQASDNRVFLYFLGMLRNKYLSRENGYAHTFHSVILAGVYDIKNIKLKLIKEGVYSQNGDIGRIYNSPWNIAADFDVDMSFSSFDIAGMLKEYEGDHETGMDIPEISDKIYEFTSGYPFLVSRICQHIDEKLEKNWSKDGVAIAIKAIIDEHNVLFDDLAKNLETYKDLYDFLYDVLIVGEVKTFNIMDPVVNLGNMFGYIKKGDCFGRNVAISNKIFEICISNYFISKDSNSSRMNKCAGGALYQDVVKDGSFDMELCLRKFAAHYREIFSDDDAPFLERHGRLLFLSYLKPLINGLGFYHIESQFTDLRRMDIVVDFGRDQFIIELKLWKGEAAKDKAYMQLLDYMASKNANRGYLLTFDFRKGKHPEQGAGWIQIDGRQIFDVTVGGNLGYPK